MGSRTSLEEVPQVVSIVSVAGGGKVSLKKDVRTYLGMHNGSLYLCTRDEVLLTSRDVVDGQPTELQGNRLV